MHSAVVALSLAVATIGAAVALTIHSAGTMASVPIQTVSRTVGST